MEGTNKFETLSHLPPETNTLFLEFTAKMTEALNKAQRPTSTTESSPQIGIKLDGSNYALWSQVMEINILGKYKLAYLNRDIPLPPPTDPTFRRWHTKNAIVKGWILNSLDPWQLHPVLHCKRSLGCNCNHLFWWEWHFTSIWTSAKSDTVETTKRLHWEILYGFTRVVAWNRLFLSQSDGLLQRHPELQ